MSDDQPTRDEKEETVNDEPVQETIIEEVSEEEHKAKPIVKAKSQKQKQNRKSK